MKNPIGFITKKLRLAIHLFCATKKITKRPQTPFAPRFGIGFPIQRTGQTFFALGIPLLRIYSKKLSCK